MSRLPRRPSRATDRLVIEPAERRPAMLDVIAGARRRLILSLFRCDDFAVLDALAAALDRGVSVEAIVTRRARGRKKELRKLWGALARMGAVVHRYADPVVKYHAKYLVADDRVSIVTTLNPTRKCFTRTVDFLLVTTDPGVARSLRAIFALDAAGKPLPPRHRLSPRLVVGPERARARMRALLASARHRIDVLDHKLTDPALAALLRERRDAGVAVSVIGRPPDGAPAPHGKMVIVDGERAVVGSLALSSRSLDHRREVNIVLRDPAVVGELVRFYGGLAERAGDARFVLPGDPPASAVA